MNTPTNTVRAAVKAAACPSPMPSAFKGCNLVNAAKKPCLATQPQQPSDPSSNAQAKKAGTQMLIYRRETLLRMLDISKSTLRNWMLEGDFPHPIQLGPRAVGWKAAQVHAWLETRAMVTPGFE